MSTVHANTPLESLRRLETLALFAEEEIPLKFLRAQVASAVQIVIQLQRLAGRRSVASIAEVLPLRTMVTTRYVSYSATSTPVRH